MILLPTEINYNTPYGVSLQKRQVAATRKGEWEFSTWDWDVETWEEELWYFVCRVIYYKIYNIYAVFVWVLSMGYYAVAFEKDDGLVLVETKIRITEKELPRSFHIFTHGTRNGTKLTTIHSTMEQCAESNWPMASLDHIAMRELAVPIFVRYLAGHRIENPRMTGPHDKYLKTTMTYVGKVGGEVSGVADDANHTSGENTGKAKDVTDDDDGDDDSKDVSSKDPEPILRSRPKHGGNTPEDAEIIANEIHDEGGTSSRIIDIGGVKLIIGQDYDGIDADNKQICGVLTAPDRKSVV